MMRPVFVCAAGALLAMCGCGTDVSKTDVERSSSGGGAKPAAEPVDRKTLISAGEAAPDFEALDVDGKVVRLSDFRGCRILLYFWFDS